MDKQKSPCVLQDFVPFKAAAQKPPYRVKKLSRYQHTFLTSYISHCKDARTYLKMQHSVTTLTVGHGLLLFIAGCCSFPCINHGICVTAGNDGVDYCCDCSETGYYGKDCEIPEWSTWLRNMVTPSKTSIYKILCSSTLRPLWAIGKRAIGNHE